MGHADDADGIVVLVAWPDVAGVAIVALLLLLLMLLLLGESIAGCCAGVEGTDDVALVRPIVRSLDASSMVAIHKAYVLVWKGTL